MLAKKSLAYKPYCVDTKVPRKGGPVLHQGVLIAYLAGEKEEGANDPCPVPSTTCLRGPMAHQTGGDLEIIKVGTIKVSNGGSFGVIP